MCIVPAKLVLNLIGEQKSLISNTHKFFDFHFRKNDNFFEGVLIFSS